MAWRRGLMPPSRHVFAACVVNNPGSGIGTLTFSSLPTGGAAGEQVLPVPVAPRENHVWPYAYLEGVMDKGDPRARCTSRGTLLDNGLSTEHQRELKELVGCFSVFSDRTIVTTLKEHRHLNNCATTPVSSRLPYEADVRRAR
ncbi:hypothetical protein PoB_006592000 [Plakobranchus ocellatus]|uniref:Uncharacterized protein n=1 Tax=Plakobranchus ocellatus TaxID=259542 RepID=A0AAV4D5J0_9GAST|nr:hypothetical protein PoB_006592000 [Plakobranchus ocellatus]